MKTEKLKKIFEDKGLTIHFAVDYVGEVFTVATADVTDPLIGDGKIMLIHGEGIARKSNLDKINRETGSAIAINRALMACYKKMIRKNHPIHSAFMG